MDVKRFTQPGPGPSEHPGLSKHAECAQIITQFVLKSGNDNNILTSRDFLKIWIRSSSCFHLRNDQVTNNMGES